MKNVFRDIDILDKRCYDKFYLSEDILMENASLAISNLIRKRVKLNSKILIVAGIGNNGADGIAVARQLHKDYRVKLYLLDKESKSKMFQLQLKRFLSINGKIIKKIEKKNYSVVVDAIFGSGLKRELNLDIINIIRKLNRLDGLKIACDIPTGILRNSLLSKTVFNADITVTMGAINYQLLNDNSKDFIGELVVANLGISNKIYDIKSNIIFLEKKDLQLPFRDKSVTHKGSFGHSYIISGEQKGASILSALACEKFGSGLTTLLSKNRIDNIPYTLMQSSIIKSNISAIAIGMGLGNQFNNKEILDILDIKVPKVIDADIFSKNIFREILKLNDVIITPHPKEFVIILEKVLNLKIDVETLQSSRLDYIDIFMKKYPKIILVLKGSNTIIAYKKKRYIVTFGKAHLSKGGSGDILAGMITALLAQGYKPFKSAYNGVLAHSLLYKNINNFAYTAETLIERIAYLK